MTDPLMGLLVDRTRTRYGQFRPFLLWGRSVWHRLHADLLHAGFLCAGQNHLRLRNLHSADLVYTFVNVPYCAMPGVITADPKERHALQSWRFFSAAAGCLPLAASRCRW